MGTRITGARGARAWGLVLAAGGVVMVPWMVLLGGALPPTVRVHHWSVVWIGLDAMMAVCLSVTGFLLWRGDERFRLFAMSAATMFTVDAWFDTMTAAPGMQRFFSCFLAVFFELPIVLLCLWVAFRAARRPVGNPLPVTSASE
ncbi:hypothetical protein [Actinokineospora enzanensis]|uniref:hypothetical protein n=1 Tax=Actinokineospora enzanensis TaxID=155975 RepID=UPI0003808A3C|nr:hypothetical protein [Actinokineospora enzanensis]